VLFLEDAGKELSELKTLYDELWSDARTLVKDMKKSILIYLYAGLVTLIVAFASLVGALPYFLLLLSLGTGNLVVWAVVVIEVVGNVIVISFGARLLIWYRKLKRRYSKLLEMERNWRSPNAS
jgi:hypothetical protein